MKRVQEHVSPVNMQSVRNYPGDYGFVKVRLDDGTIVNRRSAQLNPFTGFTGVAESTNQPSQPANQPSQPAKQASQPANEPSEPAKQPSEPANVHAFGTTAVAAAARWTARFEALRAYVVSHDGRYPEQHGGGGGEEGELGTWLRDPGMVQYNRGPCNVAPEYPILRFVFALNTCIIGIIGEDPCSFEECPPVFTTIGTTCAARLCRGAVTHAGAWRAGL